MITEQEGGELDSISEGSVEDESVVERGANSRLLGMVSTPPYIERRIYCWY